MKSNIAYTLMIIGTAIAINSCGNGKVNTPKVSEDNNDSTYVEDSMTVVTEQPLIVLDDIKTRSYHADNMYMFDNDDYKSYHKTVFHMQWPTEIKDYNASKLQTALIKDVFGNSFNTLSEGLKSVNAHDDNAIIIKSIPAGVSKQDISIDKTDVKLQSIYNNVIIFCISNYTYEPEIQGIENVRYLLYDMRSDNIVNFNTMFETGNTKKIIKLIETELCREIGVKSTDELKEKGYSLKNVLSPENFYFDNNYVTFKFELNEIAARNAGLPEVKVAVSKLLPYMTQFGKTLYAPVE